MWLLTVFLTMALGMLNGFICGVALKLLLSVLQRRSSQNLWKFYLSTILIYQIKYNFSGGTIKLANISGIFKNSKYYTKASHISEEVAIIRIKCSIDYLTVDSIFENFPKKTTLIGNFYYKFIFYKLFLVDFCRVSTIDYQGMTKLKSVAKDYSQFLLVEVDEKLYDSMKNSELFEISTVSGFVLILFLH